MPSEHSTSVLIVGGGTGGVAAALAVARRGQSCILTEPSDWVGGQLTAQAVPPDENVWIEGLDGTHSATASYRAFRRRVRDWYRTHRQLTDAAADDPRLNPGGGWVSRLCFEPTVGHAVLMDMLRPSLDAGHLRLLLHHEPVAADVDGDTVRAVTLRDVRDDQRVTITADYIIDATEMGDLLPLTDAEYAVGAEHRDTHGELHGRTDHTDPMDQQAVTWCFAMEHRPGEDHTIDRPASYDRWKSFVPELNEPWPGPLFSWVCCDAHGKPTTLAMMPWPDEPDEGTLELWRYRRIVDRSIHRNDPPPDVTLMNCVQTDYFIKPTLDVGAEAQAVAFAEAREQSLCFFYWMQTDAPRHDGGAGYRGLRLRGDELGTTDGFAKTPYIREARRLNSRTVVHEGHVGAQQRRDAGHPDIDPLGLPAAEPFNDSVGIGHYRLDLHPSAAGRNSLYVESAPFRIPLGALVPAGLTNLLAGGKNLGVTHITNGCYRLHPVEWNIGEAAGELAAWCIRHKQPPAAVHTDAAASPAPSDFQRQLLDAGFPLAWPWETCVK